MSNEPQPKPIEILLVEDNEADLVLTKRALQRSAKVTNRVAVARDGAEALDYLFRRGPFANVPLPDLVLLDLNLPKFGGLEVLEIVKKDPAIGHIPIIIMTGSDAESDVTKSYSLHASCFLTKPVKLENFLKAVASLADFWLTIVKLPTAANQKR